MRTWQFLHSIDEMEEYLKEVQASIKAINRLLKITSTPSAFFPHLKIFACRNPESTYL